MNSANIGDDFAKVMRNSSVSPKASGKNAFNVL